MVKVLLIDLKKKETEITKGFIFGSRQRSKQSSLTAFVSQLPLWLMKQKERLVCWSINAFSKRFRTMNKTSPFEGTYGETCKPFGS